MWGVARRGSVAADAAGAGGGPGRAADDGGRAAAPDLGRSARGRSALHPAVTGSIAQAYREEADQTLRGRLVAMAVRQVAWAYTAHVSACVLALGLAFLPGSLPWQRWIAGGLGVAMVTILNTYNGIAGFGAERTALSL